MRESAEARDRARVLETQLCLLDSIDELRDALTEAEKKFADAYLGDNPKGAICNRAEAYRAVNPHAKPTNASQTGKQWLEKDHVKAYVRKRQDLLSLQAEATHEIVVAMAKKNWRQASGLERVRKSRISEDGEIVDIEVYEPSLSSAVSAVGVIAKIAGLAGDDQPQRVELHQHFGALEQLPDEDLAAIQAILERRAAKTLAVASNDIESSEEHAV